MVRKGHDLRKEEPVLKKSATKTIQICPYKIGGANFPSDTGNRNKKMKNRRKKNQEEKYRISNFLLVQNLESRLFIPPDERRGLSSHVHLVCLS